MAVYVTLHNSAGEIARERVCIDNVGVEDGQPDSAELSEAIRDAMSDWTLAVGDTIKIIEDE